MQWIEVLGNYCIRLGRYVKSEGGNGCKVLEQIIDRSRHKDPDLQMIMRYARMFCYFDGTSQRNIVPPGVREN